MSIAAEALSVILQRRAVKVFDATDIPEQVRSQILDAARHAPSSFNLQPYKFYWVDSPANKAAIARLCLGQKPAETASALVVAVADLASLRDTSEAQLDWMRRNNFSQEKTRDYERTAKIGRILFAPGPLELFAAIKWALFRLLNVGKVMGMPPLFRADLLRWAVKSTSLACENLMIAAEALGMNTCPMEGFDARRLSRFLGLSSWRQEIVMVIAVGKRAHIYNEPPQWRRPLEATVVLL